MKKENTQMLKIVYFDETSATDYLIIKNKGITTEITQQLNSKNNEKNLEGGGRLWAKIPIFLLSIGGGIRTEGQVKIENNETNIIKKTISNSLLTDFINELDDNQIIKFENYDVTPKYNSITYIKMFTPYLKMIKNEFESDGAILNLSGMDKAFEDGKGYYELIATSENTKKIFRFNISSFRNKYNIVDLTKMNLTYYGIKVGEIEENKLDIYNELNINDNEKILKLEDIEKKSDDEDKDLLPIYDIILAGVYNNEN